MKLRDTMHMLELALLAWFWMTPIVYPFMMIEERGGILAQIYKLQPDGLGRRHVPAGDLQPDRPGEHDRHRVDRRPAHPTPGSATTRSHIGIVLRSRPWCFVAGLAYFGRVEGNFSEEL